MISLLVLTAVTISDPEPILKSPAVFVAVGVHKNGFSCELKRISNLSCTAWPIGFAPKQITWRSLSDTITLRDLVGAASDNSSKFFALTLVPRVLSQ